MKFQEVILKAAAGKLKWWEAAEILGITDRQLRRMRLPPGALDEIFVIMRTVLAP
jgi:hypothetical protein